MVRALLARRAGGDGAVIDAQGWVSWAVKLPGPLSKTYVGVNPVKGVFMHSAEGYAPHLLNLAVNGPLSWHGSITFDGAFHQHYSLLARCAHATAANMEYVGIENEGVAGLHPSLMASQIVTAARLLGEIAAWKGWTPSRPAGATDTSHTLWEHREVTRLGGTSTACPSGRIPWAEILTQIANAGGDDMPPENYLGELNHRRARDQIEWWLQNGEVVADFDEVNRIRLWTKDHQLVGTVPIEISEWVKPS